MLILYNLTYSNCCTNKYKHTYSNNCTNNKITPIQIRIKL